MIGRAPADGQRAPSPADRGQSPTVPSTSSRMRSAWPLWRAYSSIMWSMIQRRLTGSPRRTPVASSDSAAASMARGLIALAAPRREVGRPVGVGHQLEVAVGVLVVVVVERRGVLAGQHATEPAPLDLGHVAHEAVEAEQRARDGPRDEPGAVEPLALQLERRPVEVEPLPQRRALGREERRIGALGHGGQHGLRDGCSRAVYGREQTSSSAAITTRVPLGTQCPRSIKLRRLPQGGVARTFTGWSRAI